MRSEGGISKREISKHLNQWLGRQGTEFNARVGNIGIIIGRTLLNEQYDSSIIDSQVVESYDSDHVEMVTVIGEWGERVYREMSPITRKVLYKWGEKGELVLTRRGSIARSIVVQVPPCPRTCRIELVMSFANGSNVGLLS
jgi:hypothetical protein